MFEYILLPLDGSSLAERVLPHAVALSKAFNSKLTLLRVINKGDEEDQNNIINPMTWQIRKSEAEAYLKSVQKHLGEVDVDSELKILEGNPAQQIIDFARNEDVELIIMSSHGSSGVSAWNINSTVQKVLLRAFMPIMIIRAYQEDYGSLTGLKYHRLFLPLDGSKRAECILPLAKSICSAQDSKVFLTHIIEEPRLPRQTPIGEDVNKIITELREINLKEARTYMTQMKEQFDPVNVEIIVETSEKPSIAMHNIIDREKIDLVMLSAHGYSGESRWPYGQIALSFITYGTTPLLIVQDLSIDEVGKTLAEKFAEQSKGH
ncbi:MAG: universal stress protein [Chloroflexota bacterium]|nr:universal stress protein [Chloroflexota bacterium]